MREVWIQELAGVSTPLHTAEARMPLPVPRLRRANRRDIHQDVALYRPDACFHFCARLEVFVCVRAVAFVRLRPENVEAGCAGSVVLACWCIDRLVFHLSGPVVVSGVAYRVLVVVPVAEAAYAVGSGEVGNTLKATQTSHGDAAAIPAEKLDFRVPDGIVPDKDLRLDAISLSGTQLALGTMLVPVHGLCNVHDALENAGAQRQPYVEHVRCELDVRAQRQIDRVREGLLRF